MFSEEQFSHLIRFLKFRLYSNSQQAPAYDCTSSLNYFKILEALHINIHVCVTIS